MIGPPAGSHPRYPWLRRSGTTVTFHRLLADGTRDPDHEPIHLPAYSFKLDGRELLIPEEPLMEATEIPARPTKAAMLEMAEERDAARRLLARREADLIAAQADVADWKDAKVADPEAEALSGCVRAIEGLLTSQSTGRTVGGYSVGYAPPVPMAGETPIGRILLHLANRYGVPLVASAPQATNSEEPVLLTVPRRLAEQLESSGQAFRG